MGFTNRVTEMLGIEIPIVQAPMGWIARAPLASAVSNAGAMGIICPMINSREEAQRFIGACRYHPDGYRSVGPIRAAMYAGADYIVKANETVMAIAMCGSPSRAT